jgi:aryl-alcohol dehydrogenase-like predicted oxidoreductase
VQTIALPHTDLSVSPICLGTNTFGTAASRPEQLRESVRACSLRLDAEELAALPSA